jgi:hypothetical protein
MSISVEYSYCISLSQEEKDLIDTKVIKNREELYRFIKKFHSNSKMRMKKTYIYVIWTISFASALPPLAVAVILPTPTYYLTRNIEQINFQSRASKKINTFKPSTIVIKEKINKITLTNQEIEKFDVIMANYIIGLRNLEIIFPELRGGDFLDEFLLGLFCVAFFSYLWQIQPVDAFFLPQQHYFNHNHGHNHGYGNPFAPTSNNGKSYVPNEKDSVRSQKHLLFCDNKDSTKLKFHLQRDSSEYKDLVEGYEEVHRRASEIGCENFDFPFTRFESLARENGILRSGGITGLDYFVQDVGRYSHITHVDVKNPVSLETIINQNAKFTLVEQGENLGIKIDEQKRKWANEKMVDKIFAEHKQKRNVTIPLPKSPKNVLSIIDLFNLPVGEKNVVKEAILRTLKDDTDNIFINDK